MDTLLNVNPKNSCQTSNRWIQSTLKVSAILLVTIGLPLPGLAQPETGFESPTRLISVAAPPEVDSSLSRTYRPATIYLPDPDTQRLVPQIVSVAEDQSVAGAVGQIIESYEGQDVGIVSYDIQVNQPEHLARVDFEVRHERGADVFQSLSSTNQVALFEAIRETLLTQPTYSIDEIIFSANGENFDI